MPNESETIADARTSCLRQQHSHKRKGDTNKTLKWYSQFSGQNYIVLQLTFPQKKTSKHPSSNCEANSAMDGTHFLNSSFLA